MPIETAAFYTPWPLLGQEIQLTRQWDAIRSDIASLAAIAKAAYYDTFNSSIYINRFGGASLTGQAFGELSFRNHFRHFYDKTVDEFKIQVNTGTEGSPVWVDYVRIRQSDGRVIVAGNGGLEVQGGFYNTSFLDVEEIEPGETSFTNVRKMKFGTGFYLTPDSQGNVVVNLV